MDTVRTCLGALRTSLSPQDPQQQTIDQLEQAMASLADQRMMMSSPTNTTSPTPSKRYSSRSTRHVSTTGLNIKKVNHSSLYICLVLLYHDLFCFCMCMQCRCCLDVSVHNYHGTFVITENNTWSR